MKTPKQQELSTLGQRLREAREYLGLTLQHVADVLHVDMSAVSMWETDRRRPHSSNLTRLAAYYKVSLTWLVDGQPAGDEEAARLFSPALSDALSRLTPNDRVQVLRFAQFLRHAGPLPSARNEEAQK